MIDGNLEIGQETHPEKSVEVLKDILRVDNGLNIVSAGRTELYPPDHYVAAFDLASGSPKFDASALFGSIFIQFLPEFPGDDDSGRTRVKDHSCLNGAVKNDINEHYP